MPMTLDLRTCRKAEAETVSCGEAVFEWGWVVSEVFGHPFPPRNPLPDCSIWAHGRCVADTNVILCPLRKS